MAALAGGCSVAEVTPRLVDKLLAQYPACLGFPWPNPLSTTPNTPNTSTP